MRTAIDPKELVDFVFGRFPRIYQNADEQIGIYENTRIVRFRNDDGNYEWKYYFSEDWENHTKEELEHFDLHIEIRGPLYRYIMSIVMTAGAETLERSEQLWYAQDPHMSPDRLFPDWYENFGIPYFNDIPIWFQRKILSILGELYMRKGTRGAIEYLAQEVTGFSAEINDLKYNNFRTWSPYVPFVLHHKPSKLSATLKSPDNVHRLATFNPSNVGRGRVREVQLTLTAPFDEATTRVRERVLRRFLRYFMPYDVLWTVLTRWFFEDTWKVTESSYLSWDELKIHDNNDVDKVVNYEHEMRLVEYRDEHYETIVHQAALTNGHRWLRNTPYEKTNQKGDRIAGETGFYIKQGTHHALLGRFRLNSNWKLGLGDGDKDVLATTDSFDVNKLGIESSDHLNRP